jgi:transposase
VKGLDCQAERALLVARAQIVSQITTLKNCVRGILKTFGRVLPKGLRSQFPARVRAAIDGHPVLGAIVEPTLQVLEAARAQLLVYDKAVIQRARSDDTARLLMSAPGVGVVVALAYMTGVEDPARFKRSSSVAAYFGMTPRRYQSGEVDHAGRIVAFSTSPLSHNSERSGNGLDLDSPSSGNHANGNRRTCRNHTGDRLKPDSRSKSPTRQQA